MLNSKPKGYLFQIIGLSPVGRMGGAKHLGQANCEGMLSPCGHGWIVAFHFSRKFLPLYRTGFAAMADGTASPAEVTLQSFVASAAHK